jgi:hypothetical protein
MCSSVHTYNNHPQAAFGSLGQLLTRDADVFTQVDHSLWDDRIEERRERYEAARLRRASGKTGERSNMEGERSNFEGERGKNFGAGATSAASPATS